METVHCWHELESTSTWIELHEDCTTLEPLTALKAGATTAPVAVRVMPPTGDTQRRTSIIVQHTIGH